MTWAEALNEATPEPVRISVLKALPDDTLNALGIHQPRGLLVRISIVGLRNYATLVAQGGRYAGLAALQFNA